MPRLQIDDQWVEFLAGETVLQTARRVGLRIPTLCHHPDLPDVGSCRICLVEIEGSEHLVPACKHPASDDLHIRTHTASTIAARQMILHLLVSQGGFRSQSHHGCSESQNVMSCTARPRPLTEFDRLLQEYQIAPTEGLAPRYSIDSDPSPFLHVDLNQCILCARCIRACADVQGRFVWGLSQRGHEAHLEAGAGVTLDEAACEGCGACAAYCPTGAISDRIALQLPVADRRVTTTCAYCGVGCQFDLNVIDDHVVQVTSNPDAPVNGMHLCVKGRYGFDYIHHPDRLTRPRVRRELLEGRSRVPGQPRGPWIDVDWDTALQMVATRMVATHQQSGPESLGFLSSAKCTNEENYLVQKIARQIFGTHNVDHCARLCHSSTVAGLSMAIGSGAMSQSMADLAEHAAVFFVIGSNTTEQHPVFGTMLRQAVLQRGAKLIVADPRRIDLVDFATLHLRHRPGTDIALVNGLIHLILKHGWQDEAFIADRTENYEAVREAVAGYPPERVAQITNLSVQDLEAVARLLGTQRPGAVIWAMGITQHITGVMNVLALANLQLVLGNFGCPGGGVNPLRGQNNVQGACDMGALPNVFPGYQYVTDAGVRDAFAQAWALDGLPTTMSAQPGLTLTEMIAQAGSRALRSLYVMGENPVLTDPHSAHVRDCLSAAEFVVLQEIFPSATAEYADIVLPGTTFAEKDGTFTNTERRVQLVRQAISPVGESRPDWRILAELGQRCLSEQNRQSTGPYAAYSYRHPAEIMEEIRAITPVYHGITHARLDRGEALAWPVPDLDSSGTPILHQQSFPRGRGRFHVVEHLPPHELPDADYPLLLTTGRVLYHWHAGEMTHRSHGLQTACPEPVVEINPVDAERLGIAEHDTIQLESRRGQMTARAGITDRVAEGVVFANFHFRVPRNANELTQSTPLDPVAKIPEYKVTAVRLLAVRDL